MSKITQYSRISHHTIAGSMSATFSVPTSEDFTDGSWTSRDLALSEIGVNEDSKKAYIRINDEVKEFQLAGGTSSAEPLSTTLVAGNTTGPNDIIIDLDQSIRTTDTGFIQFGDTGSDLNAILINNGGDGVTNPQNSFGFSGVDPYWTAQTVDIAGVTDMITLAPTGLGNGTGIKSIDTTTGDYNYVKLTPTQINIFQDDITNGQIRYITLGLNAISLVADSSSIIIDEGSQTISLSTETYGTLGASTNKISIGSSNVRNVISTSTITTTNAATTTIHTFICVGDGPKSYKVRVIGNKSDYTKAYLGELFGLYNYVTSTVTLIGSLDLVEKTNFTTATSTISISGSTILVRVTGEASTTINWSVYVEMNDNY